MSVWHISRTMSIEESGLFPAATWSQASRSCPFEQPWLSCHFSSHRTPLRKRVIRSKKRHQIVDQRSTASPTIDEQIIQACNTCGHLPMHPIIILCHWKGVSNTSNALRCELCNILCLLLTRSLPLCTLSFVHTNRRKSQTNTRRPNSYFSTSSAVGECFEKAMLIIWADQRYGYHYHRSKAEIRVEKRHVAMSIKFVLSYGREVAYDRFWFSN
jgi:hypothetical protein